MGTWDTYPANYRKEEVTQICQAVCAGECVSVVGLSGAGKSNLLGFIANRVQLNPPCPRFVLIDCNRLPTVPGGGAAPLLELIRRSLARLAPDLTVEGLDPFFTLDDTLQQLFTRQPETGLCLLLDRFDALDEREVPGSLRALRDAHKYQLTYVTATRRPLDPLSELAELFFGHTLWLGPLSREDARWSAKRYAARQGLSPDGWEAALVERLIDLSWGYPSLLRAACEAYAQAGEAALNALPVQAAVQRRVAEFWADAPDEAELERCGLKGQPLLEAGRTAGREMLQAGASLPSSSTPPMPPQPAQPFDTRDLTAKEHHLLVYFLAHPDQVCEKDDLIRAVWPEDKLFLQGIRDDSLAQLVRRLRKKIEPDPANPVYIHTVPGRGYRFTLPTKR